MTQGTLSCEDCLRLTINQFAAATDDPELSTNDSLFNNESQS